MRQPAGDITALQYGEIRLFAEFQQLDGERLDNLGQITDESDQLRLHPLQREIFDARVLFPRQGYMTVGHQHPGLGHDKSGAGELAFGDGAVALQRQQRLAPRRKQHLSLVVDHVPKHAIGFGIAETVRALQKNDRAHGGGDYPRARLGALLQQRQPFGRGGEPVAQLLAQGVEIARA